jgi:hypothetical protein
MMKQIALVSLMAAVFSAPALAAEKNQASVLAYGVVGTGGAGLGLGFQPAGNTVLRAELAQYTKSYTKDESDISYAGDLKLSTRAVYADYHPFSGAFRVTAGVDFGGMKADLGAKPSGSGTYTVNGNTYPTGAGDRIDASIKYPSTMPYLGLGWGLGDFSQSGLRFGVDLGANIGKPAAQLTASGAMASDPQFNSDLNEENRKLNDDVSKVKVFPVLKIAIGYAF